jgi:hypothetical protein
MKVKLLTDSKHGPAGKYLTDENAWRLCFPVKGCVAKCVDAEAVAAALGEIETVRGTARDRLMAQMKAAGTVPCEDGIEKSIEKPKPAPKANPKVTEVPPPKPKDTHASFGTSAQPASGPAVHPHGTGSSGQGS